MDKEKIDKMVEDTLRRNERRLAKSLIWFVIYIVATIWLFLISWKIGLTVTLIGLAILNDKKI